MNRLTIKHIGLLLLLTLSKGAFATTVEYQVANLGGDAWQYMYKITNDDSSLEVTELTTYFDVENYSDLTVLSSPANWDSIVIAADNSLPADGFFDSLALGTGIPLGKSLSGFVVGFTYLGAGTPGDQIFELRDASFSLLSSGQTVQIPAAVPLPPAVFEMLLGLMMLFSIHNKKSA